MIFRAPDAEVLFELTSLAYDNGPKFVRSGYRPAYDIRSDYWTSTNHEFIGCEGIGTGESARANVWLITPEVYPNTLWIGRILQVAEGSRIIGQATVLAVHNPVLKAEQGSDPSKA